MRTRNISLTDQWEVPRKTARLDHARAMKISSRTATNIRRMYKPQAADVQPREVIDVLNQAGVEFTLLGAHGIAGWLDEPRATQDVDVVVHKRHRQAVQAIKKAFPKLLVHDLSAVTRFMDPLDGLPAIDLIKGKAGLFKAVRRHTFPVGKSYRIPNLEMALVLKFAAMIAPNRSRRKKYQDKADFAGMVKHNFEIIDRDQLRQLGELVKPGGGAEAVQMVDDANADRPLRS